MVSLELRKNCHKRKFARIKIYTSTRGGFFFPCSVLFGVISKSGLGKTLNDQTAKTMSFYWNATISRTGGAFHGSEIWPSFFSLPPPYVLKITNLPLILRLRSLLCIPPGSGVTPRPPQLKVLGMARSKPRVS